MWRARRVGRREAQGEKSLELDLMTLRPEPSRELVKSIARRVRPAEERRRLVPRVAMASGITVALLVAVASFGGISSAANRLSEWGTAISHVAIAHPASPGLKLSLAPANSQYQPSVASSIVGAPRAGYCSVAGDKLPDGTPISPNTFLNLALGQPDVDPLYTGALPAFYIQGIGITCDAPSSSFSLSNVGPVDDLGQPNPPGIQLPGNIYPYFAKK